MTNLYNTIAVYSKKIDGVKVSVLRIEDKFGYCFELNGKEYGNFLTAKRPRQEDIDELAVMLEGTARNVIKTLKTTC